MTRRPPATDTVRFVLELLKRIPRTHSVTAAQLHDQLPDGSKRDIRTVQRQLETLCEQFDIERDDSSKPYGYRWKRESGALAMQSMTDQEALLLTLAEKHLRNLLPANVMKSADGFFSQARRRLDPLTGSRPDREWLDKVRVVGESPALLPPPLVDGVFDVVSRALYENIWLAIDYRNAVGKRISARVMPLGLAQQGVRLFLVCRFEGFDDERTLAMHRIVSAEAATAFFVRPADFSLATYEADGRFAFGEGVRVELRIHIDKSAGHHLIESPLSSDQNVIECADTYEITATVVDSAGLRWWLRGFGDQIRVLAPTELVDP